MVARECRVEGSGRATRDDRALREHVASKRMRQCDCGVQREEGECVVSQRTDIIVPRFNDFNALYALSLRCYKGKVDDKSYYRRND